jgi:AraC family transcriptional regulator
VRIVTAPTRHIALLMHRGAPALLGESLRRFIAWRRAHALPPSRSATFNLIFEDPLDVAPDDWRFGLACECPADVEPGAGLAAAELEGGRYAVLRVSGGDAELTAALDLLYGDWLPLSGETPREHPLWLERLSFYPDVPETQALSEIWLPLCGNPPSGANPRPTA